VSVTVTPAARPHRARVIVTHVTVDDAAGLGGRLTLHLDVNGQAVRWPQAGSARVEDGKTLDVDARFDVVLEGTSVLAVSVTGAGDGGEPGGVVKERWPSTVEWGAGVHAYRSRLPAGGQRDLAPHAGRHPEPGRYTVNFLVEVAPEGG